MKRKMINDLHRELLAAGYEVSKEALLWAYPEKLDSGLLWAVWKRRRTAIHWAAAKLVKRGVVFTKRPPLPPPDPLPLHDCFFRPPRWGADLQLPTGDRD